jgi:hypothetical protein
MSLILSPKMAFYFGSSLNKKKQSARVAFSNPKMGVVFLAIKKKLSAPPKTDWRAHVSFFIAKNGVIFGLL